MELKKNEKTIDDRLKSLMIRFALR